MPLKQETDAQFRAISAEKTSSDLTPPSVSRRSFIQSLLAIPAFGVVGCGREPESATANGNAEPHFFNAEERRFVEAASERLIPSGDTADGAKEADVAEFIDRQLAGPYGRAETWYMQGPWKDGTAEQGYQLKLTPAQLYRSAIRNLQAYCREQFGNKGFAQLAPAEQDKLLADLQNGKIELPDVPAKEFFSVLLQNTIEGFLADPLYGGNRNFVGWKLIGFPGPRYNYTKEITQHGKPYTVPTVGLLGRETPRKPKG